MAMYYQTESSENLHINQFGHLVESECKIDLGKFKSILTSYALFHLTFALLALLQLTLVIGLLISNPTSSVFAVAIASLLLTICSHLIITYYFQVKKTIQFL